MRRRVGAPGAALALMLLAVATLTGQSSPAGVAVPQGMDMPDVRQMSGIPLPVGDLPPGTVTVRVVRGALSNPIPKQRVEIVGATKAPVETNDAGRAEFSGLPVGARIKAVGTIDGQRIESQEFAVPAAGGIRLMLVAADPETARREAEDRALAQGPARSGIVVFGDQSRFIFEIGEDGLNVFSIFEIQNTARTPVNPVVPIVFDLPDRADQAAVLEGSSPRAKVVGRQVVVEGPFPPGMTLVQFAYTMPTGGGNVAVSQRLPAALAQVTVVAQKVGELRMRSEQVGQPREMQAESGVYLVAQGPPLAAGDAVTVAFEGLPGVPVWPRNVALALAVTILLAGAGAAFKGREGTGARRERERLEAEREHLLEHMTALEAAYRAGTVDPDTYAARRRTLLVGLERIYAALDEEVAA